VADGMSASDFGKWAIGYYGPWPEGMKSDIRDYLTERTPEYLAMLKRVCLDKVPSRMGQVNGYPPDVAKMQELAEETSTRLEAEARHGRELEYAAKALPAPEPQLGSGDLMRLDWSQIFARGIAARKQAVAEGKIK